MKGHKRRATQASGFLFVFLHAKNFPGNSNTILPRQMNAPPVEIYLPSRPVKVLLSHRGHALRSCLFGFGKWETHFKGNEKCTSSWLHTANKKCSKIMTLNRLRPFATSFVFLSFFFLFSPFCLFYLLQQGPVSYCNR